MSTFEQKLAEADEEIMEFMRRYPNTYGHLNTVEEFIDFENSRQEQEAIIADQNGWEGD